MVNLVDLPTVLLHVMCSFLNQREARICRLTCKMIGDVADCYAFQELVFYLHHDNFEMLQHFANHRIISKNVKSLVYVTKVLKLQQLSYEKYMSQIIEAETAFEWGHAKHIASSDIQSWSNCTDDGFRNIEAYQQYLQVHQRQHDILANGEDLTVLKNVIPKFTSLHSIMVSADQCFRHCLQEKAPLDEICVRYRTEDLEPMACRQIGSVLLPLVGLDPRLRALRLGCVDGSCTCGSASTGVARSVNFQQDEGHVPQYYNVRSAN